MWASKEKFESLQNEIENLKKILKDIPNYEPIYETITELKVMASEKPKEDEQITYLNEIKKIVENKFFQWFFYNVRETIISQVAGNMPLKNAVFFMKNNDEVAGGIKALDYLIQQAEEKKIQYLEIMEAENAANI